MTIFDETVINGNRAMCRSYAKINLTLDITGKRADGYHEVEMIMQTVSLYDLVIVDAVPRGISIVGNVKHLPWNEKNIAYKAAALFFERTGIKGGAKILLKKNIPVAAGLAGGSGNAAAVLVALNALYGEYLPYEKLACLAAELGADVPFCINGGTQLATGIGEVLTPLPSFAGHTVLIVKPPVNVSTAEIYKRIDSAPITDRPDTPAVIRAIEAGDFYGVASGLGNVMESVTAAMHPSIGGIKQKMLLNGAAGALMSGSGSAVFGLFDDYKKAKKSADSFAYQYGEVYLVKTI